MTQKVFELLKACCESKGEDDYAFTRENGKQVKDFRGSWENARKAAGVPGLKVHDLRRTGARNMRRRGVDRDVIMKIGGWKTDSVFRRYNIVDERDPARSRRAPRPKVTVESQFAHRRKEARDPAHPRCYNSMS